MNLKEELAKRAKRLADEYGDQIVPKRHEGWWAITTYFKKGHESTEDLLIKAMGALEFYSTGGHLREADHDVEMVTDTDGMVIEDHIVGKKARDTIEEIRLEIVGSYNPETPEGLK